MALDTEIEAVSRAVWLGLPWHGNGLMMEAASTTNDYWFDVLDFNVLRAPKAAMSFSSRRISEKTGMRVIAIYESDVSGRLPTEAWEITAEEWSERRKGLSEEC